MIFPLAYFGSLYYFESLIQSDSVTFEIWENFPKQTFRNRADIVTANGIQSLSIPVMRTKGQRTPMNEVKVDYSKAWQNDHWRAIQSAYKNSPYFDYYGVEVEELIMKKYDSLIELNLATINKVSSWLELPLQYELTSEFLSLNHALDPREEMLSKKKTETLMAPYIQTFSSPKSYHKNVSILDGIFCEGPTLRKLLIK